MQVVRAVAVVIVGFALLFTAADMVDRVSHWGLPGQGSPIHGGPGHWDVDRGASAPPSTVPFEVEIPFLRRVPRPD
jgi:hypothetical protein